MKGANEEARRAGRASFKAGGETTQPHRHAASVDSEICNAPATRSPFRHQPVASRPQQGTRPLARARRFNAWASGAAQGAHVANALKNVRWNPRSLSPMRGPPPDRRWTAEPNPSKRAGVAQWREVTRGFFREVSRDGRNLTQCPPPTAGPVLCTNGGLASQITTIKARMIQPMM